MFVETFDEFSARHGEYLDVADGWRLFANGAAASNDGRLTSFREPPLDPVELLRVQRVFVVAKLERERYEWTRFYNDVSEQAGYALRFPDTAPPAPANAAEQLEAGKRRMKALEKQVEEIDEQLALSPEARLMRLNRQRDAERNRKLQAQFAAIQTIRLE